MSESVPAVFEMHDPRFVDVHGDSRLERLHAGSRWAEGPVYFAAGRYLVWSDIPNDRMLRWDETTGAVGVFRQPAGYTNGHTVDREGRLVSAHHGWRGISRTEHDGSVTVLVDRWEGQRFNSPNDIVVRRDGTIWFTDPPYGITSDYEGFQADQEISGCHVYRFDPADGSCVAAATGFGKPNGLAFSVDYDRLYVSDTGNRDMRVFDVSRDGVLTGGAVIAECTAGGFDGIRVDALDRLWAAAGDGLHCLHPDGTLLGKLLVPEKTSNLVFGGPKRNRLFITATTSVYSLVTSVTGAPPFGA